MGQRRHAILSWAPVPCRNQITTIVGEASVNIPIFLATTTIIGASPRSTPCQPHSHVIEHWRETEHHFSLELETPKLFHAIVIYSGFEKTKLHVLANSACVYFLRFERMDFFLQYRVQRILQEKILGLHIHRKSYGTLENQRIPVYI
ncbi:hypothetical protein VPH35_113976 [Triticum aestivum]